MNRSNCLDRQNILAGILLGCTGFAVNWFKLELFFNVDFLFGSIVTMFALMRYGVTAGTIAALLAATATWHHWHQPWAILIFTAEAFLTGLLARRRRWELLTADIFFWFSAGLLLVWFFYHQVMGLSPQATLLIALKQGVNGIFNTLVAMGFSIVFAYRGSRPRELPSMYQVLFAVLALFVLTPAMGYLYFDTRSSLKRQLESYRTSTTRVCEVSEQSLSLGLSLNRDTVKNFAALRHLLQNIVGPRAMAITLVDRIGRVVVSTRDSRKPLDPFIMPRDGSMTPVGDGVAHWIPAQEPGINSVQRWNASFYVKEIPLTLGNGWKVVVESSLGPQLEEISRRTSWSLGIIALLILTIITLSRLVAARSVLVIQKLEDVTRRLPSRISSGELITWPKPITREMAGLVTNFQVMGTAIQTYVTELESLNESLEQRVVHRTLELRENERFAADVMDSLTSNIAVLDSNGFIVSVNEPWRIFARENCASMTASNDVGKNYLSVCRDSINRVDEEKVKASFAGISAVLAGEKDHFSLEYPCHSPDQQRWFMMSVSVLKGSRHGVVVSHADISERKRAEADLREANQFIDQVVSSAQEGMVVYDLDLRYRVWNPFMERLTGMTSGEVIGRHPSELFPSLVESGLIAVLEKVLAGEPQAEIDFSCLDSVTGESRWTSNLSAPLRNGKGRIIGVIVTIREITERKQLEDKLLKALEAASAANATMSRLLSTVAHEFRTPLGLLIGSTDILDRYWDRLTPEKRLEQNAFIRSAARQMSNLINSVVAFNQLGLDRPGIPARLLDIGAVCRSIAEEVETVWGAGQACEVNIAADCGGALLDETLFRRVLENLLTNAYRYTPSDGTVSLQVRREVNRLLIEIIDTGIGIPGEDRRLIFEAFYRSRNVEGRRGLGLGLSIVQESLSQLGGTITVASRIGVGSTMRVEIPVEGHE